jgi:hypothetical protein
VRDLNTEERPQPTQCAAAALVDGTHARLPKRASARGEPTAPLWPSRTNADGDRTTRGDRATQSPARCQTALDWSEPIDMGTFYRRLFRPALVTAGLPASAPARKGTQATVNGFKEVRFSGIVLPKEHPKRPYVEFQGLHRPVEQKHDLGHAHGRNLPVGAAQLPVCDGKQ